MLARGYRQDENDSGRETRMGYEVPDLPYAYDALEPHIDEQTMRIHHDKHHQAYVDKANAALEGTEWADQPVEDVLAQPVVAARGQAGPGAQQRRRPREPLALLDRARRPNGGGTPSGELGERHRRAPSAASTT